MDEDLVKGIASGDEAALELLLDEYGALIKAVVSYHMTGFEDCIEDVLQDVLLAVWNNITSFDSSRSSLKNWIGAICKYKCIDCKRKFARLRQYDAIDENIPDERFDPQTRLDIKSILDCLPPADRELFRRRFIIGERIDEIAESTGTNPALIYNRISRARKKLRKQLGGRL